MVVLVDLLADGALQVVEGRQASLPSGAHPDSELALAALIGGPRMAGDPH